MTTDVQLPRPGHPSIRIPTDAAPYIEAYRCEACQTAFQDRSLSCRRCAHRAAPVAFHATDSGTLYSWTVVERSYPGVAVPFVSAVVDLEDGLTLKGTLRGIEPAAVKAGLPVKLQFDDAGGARDKDGAPFVGFHFLPA